MHPCQDIKYHLAKLEQLSNEELAYIAGIVDGEGCIRLHISKNGTCRAWLQIATTSKNLMTWLQEKTSLGSLYDQPLRPNRKPCVTWTVSSRQAVALIKSIRPWLIIKAPQADLIIEFDAQEKCDGIKPGLKVSKERMQRRIMVAEQLSELKLVS